MFYKDGEEKKEKGLAFNAMLAKKFRLPIQKFIGQKSKSVRSDFFIVKFKPNDLNFSRFGIVISKKVHKSAVKRNNIKRIIFNFIRTNKLHFEPGQDVLIIVSPKTSQLTKAEIEEKLNFLIS